MKIKLVVFLIIVSSLFLNAQSTIFNTPIVDNDVIFLENNGMIAVEAEYFNKQSNFELRQWYITSKDAISKVGNDNDEQHHLGASNDAYIEILPDTRVSHSDKLIQGENFSNKAGEI